MAYTAGNIHSMGYGNAGFNHYHYEAGADTIATVNTSGYFNNTDDNLNMQVNDLMTVSCSDGSAQLIVTAVSTVGVVSTVVDTPRTSLIAAGSTLTLSQELHDGKTILFDQADGSVITLPAATGTGMTFKFIVSVSVTTNTHRIITDSDSDEFAGHTYQVDTDSSDAIAAYPAIVADNFDLISMNGTTTGGLIGDWIELIDIIAGTWAVNMLTNGNGSVAAPIA